MKKIISAITAAAMLVCIALSAAAAANKVTVKNNTSSKPVTYTYDSDDTYETVKSIKSLMSAKLNEVSKTKMRTQTLTVTSESQDRTPVSFKLRVSIPETDKKPTDADYSSLDYYLLKVNSENGTLLYSYENEPENEDERTEYKDIPLGVLNSSKAAESATYNITIAANGDISDSSVISAAKKLDWSIVSEPYTEAEATASPEPSAAAAQQEDEEASPLPSISPSQAPSASPSASPAPTAKVKADKNGNYKLTSGEYSVGTDIDADRYVLTGNGPVNIYKSDGTLERTVVLKDRNNKSANGVTEYVIDLSNNEKISVDNEAMLEPYVAPTATPSPTPTPKASSSGSSSGSSTSSASSSDSKSNPKTGDNTSVEAVSVIGFAALCGAVAISLKRKKK